MTYVIVQPCVDIKDRACVTECPVDCIYEGARTLYINPEDDLPRHWAHFRSVNAEFFSATPSGLNQRCDPPRDHPLVATMAPQSLHKKEISAFTVGKEEAADVDLWFPS
ncbi:ferredoxin family protein [Streptomyces sp. NPDC005921]|uniref:ferredoxin family protein n=1 Tax=Streptomyces sp. NPDC005827 TaxID=3157070 RepID=UPI00340DAABB